LLFGFIKALSGFLSTSFFPLIPVPLFSIKLVLAPTFSATLSIKFHTLSLIGFLIVLLDIAFVLGLLITFGVTFHLELTLLTLLEILELETFVNLLGVKLLAFIIGSFVCFESILIADDFIYLL